MLKRFIFISFYTVSLKKQSIQKLIWLHLLQNIIIYYKKNNHAVEVIYAAVGRLLGRH